MSPRRARLSRLSAQRRDALAYQALRPLVRLLLASQVPHSTLTGLFKRALAAHRHERPRGRLNPDADPYAVLGPAATVVSAWSQDARWLDERGEPRELSVSPRAAHGFFALVEACAPEAQPKAVLQELKRNRTIALKARPARARLLQRAILFAHEAEFDVVALLTHVRRFQETLELNVLKLREGDPGLFERAVHAFDLPSDAFPDFERYLRNQADDLIAAGDAKLGAYRKRRSRSAREAFGFGVYLFRDKPRRRRGR